MKTFTIRAIREQDERAVVELWHACNLVVPQNDPHKDIARKREVDEEWFLVGELDGVVIASCMIGYDGHRGCINYLAVHPDHRRNRYAARLLCEAETILRSVGCPKINLLVRSHNDSVLAFYDKMGFSENGCISLGKRLEEDSPE